MGNFVTDLCHLWTHDHLIYLWADLEIVSPSSLPIHLFCYSQSSSGFNNTCIINSQDIYTYSICKANIYKFPHFSCSIVYLPSSSFVSLLFFLWRNQCFYPTGFPCPRQQIPTIIVKGASIASSTLLFRELSKQNRCPNQHSTYMHDCYTIENKN